MGSARATSHSPRASWLPTTFRVAPYSTLQRSENTTRSATGVGGADEPSDAAQRAPRGALRRLNGRTEDRCRRSLAGAWRRRLSEPRPTAACGGAGRACRIANACMATSLERALSCSPVPDDEEAHNRHSLCAAALPRASPRRVVQLQGSLPCPAWRGARPCRGDERTSAPLRAVACREPSGPARAPPRSRARSALVSRHVRRPSGRGPGRPTADAALLGLWGVRVRLARAATLLCT